MSFPTRNLSYDFIARLLRTEYLPFLDTLGIEGLAGITRQDWAAARNCGPIFLSPRGSVI
jgi:hypothetical protein